MRDVPGPIPRIFCTGASGSRYQVDLCQRQATREPAREAADHFLIAYNMRSRPHPMQLSNAAHFRYQIATHLYAKSVGENENRPWITSICVNSSLGFFNKYFVRGRPYS